MSQQCGCGNSCGGNCGISVYQIGVAAPAAPDEGHIRLNPGDVYEGVGDIVVMTPGGPVTVSPGNPLPADTQSTVYIDPDEPGIGIVINPATELQDCTGTPLPSGEKVWKVSDGAVIIPFVPSADPCTPAPPPCPGTRVSTVRPATGRFAGKTGDLLTWDPAAAVWNMDVVGSSNMTERFNGASLLTGEPFHYFDRDLAVPNSTAFVQTLAFYETKGEIVNDDCVPWLIDWEYGQSFNMLFGGGTWVRPQVVTGPDQVNVPLEEFTALVANPLSTMGIPVGVYNEGNSQIQDMGATSVLLPGATAIMHQLVDFLIINDNAANTGDLLLVGNGYIFASIHRGG